MNFWVKHRTANVKPWHEWVFDFIVKFKLTKILEVGCGIGELWVENIDRMDRTQSVVLSDFSEGMISESKKSLSKNENFKFEIFDAISIPHESDLFDTVVANHMMYHVTDINASLCEIKRVLKPGGLLFISTVTKRHRNEIISLINEGIDGIFENIDKKFNDVNANELLTNKFNVIEENIYTDRIAVTEEQVLMEYIFSLLGIQEFNDEKKEILAKHVKNYFIENKSMDITLEFILYICRKEIE
jgi:ubiquinone/menaquinone biosynthesis C-methylase UbiE